MTRLCAIALGCLFATAAAGQPLRRELGALEKVPLLRVGTGGTEEVTLSQFSGPLIVYFYGQDCADCTEQLAWLQRLAHSSSGGPPFTVLAVAVELGTPPAQRRPLELGALVTLVDEGGLLWSRLQSLEAIEAPPGARGALQRVLPQTLFVGRWVVRHHGSTRLPMDRFVVRRRMLMTSLRMFQPPSVPEIDIEDEHALQMHQWPPPPRPDAGYR